MVQFDTVAFNVPLDTL